MDNTAANEVHLAPSRYADTLLHLCLKLRLSPVETLLLVQGPACHGYSRINKSTTSWTLFKKPVNVSRVLNKNDMNGTRQKSKSDVFSQW